MQLDGAVVMVTGASSGIGAATARAAAAAGAHVVLAARRFDRVSALAGELGGLAVRCDVTRPADVAAAVGTALDRWERIDAVVNNAGQGLQASIEETSLDDFRGLLELDLIAPLMVMQAVVPVMRRQGAGAIVNVSSGTTLDSAPGTGAYAAAKLGLEQLSAVARRELADDGIAVSTIVPFITRSEFIESMRAGVDDARTSLADAPFDTPEHVADAIVELIRSGAAKVDLVPAAFGGSR